MAGTKADGSITIDTKLDNTGFKKGSEELKHAVDSLSNQVNSSKGNLQNAFKYDFGKPKQIVNTFSKAVKEVNAEIDSLGEVAERAINGDKEAFAEFDRQNTAILQKLRDMRSEMEAFGSTDFETPEHEKAAAEYEKTATQVKELSTALGEAEASFEKLTNDFGRSSEYMDLEDRIEELKMYKEEYDKAMLSNDHTAAANTFMEAGIGKGGFDEAIKEAEAEMDKMWEKFENSAPYKNTQKEIDTITQKLERAKAEAEQYKAAMEATPESFKGANTENFERSREQIQATMAKLSAFQQRINAVRPQTASLGSLLRNAFASGFRNIASGAARATRSLAKLVGTGIVRGIRAIGNAAKKAAINLASMAKNAIIGRLKKLGGAISGVGLLAGRMNGSLLGGFKTILKYAFGISTLFVLFNKLRKAMTEGFSTLAEQDARFGQTVNNFKGALETLRNSLAAAFSPIAEIVLPLLTSMINAISAAISKVGQLIAALTGRSTYRKAVYHQAGVASSAGNAADALKDEADEAEEAKKTLAGFDDVEVLSDNSSKNKGNKGGNAGSGAGAGGGGGFTEVPVENKFKKLADALKEMWKNADFTELGRKLGESLKKALDSIPWDKIKETANRLAKSLATLFNGFLEVPGLFYSIGKTVAEALNTITGALNTFATGFHWASLGQAIADGINGFFENFDFAQAAAAFSNWVKGIFTTIVTALENVDWQQIGEKVKEFLVNVDWSGIVQLLFEISGAIIGALLAFLVGLLGDIPPAIKKFFADHIQEAKDAGGSVVDGILQGIKDALVAIGTWIKEHIFDPFIKGFKAAFGIASPAREMKPLGEDIINGMLQGILNIIGTVGTWIVTNIFGPIKSGIETAFGIAGGIAGNIKSAGEAIMGGIKSGISDKWDTVTSWLEQHAPGLKNIFDRQNWDSIGDNICNGISTGLSNGWNWLTTTASNLATSIFNSACNALGIHSPSREFMWMGNMITAGLGEGINATQDTAVNAVSDVANAMIQEAEGAKPVMQISTETGDLLSGLDGVLSAFSDKVLQGFSAMLFAMEEIANGSSFMVPAMASGSVVPYSARKTAAVDDTDKLTTALEMLGARDAERLTRNDLMEILVSVCRQYMNFSFYIGDEQLARHANKGNELLGRRYST